MAPEIIPKGSHPICSATWIWPGSDTYLYNHFANFREDFQIETLPKEGMLYITADHSYRLYINGHYICRGPARGYQSHWPLDEVDITHFLQEGHNWLAVEAYNPGVSTFSYIHEACAGFICAAKWDNFSLLSDSSWKMRRSEANLITSDRFSLQMNFQEHIFADKSSREWIYSPELNEAEWDIKDKIWNRACAFTFGRSPYFALEKRDIPLLLERVTLPEKIEGHCKGKNSPGIEECKNATWPFIKEIENIGWDDGQNTSHSTKGKDFFTIEIPPSPSGKNSFQAFLIKMPEYSVGSLNIEIPESEGNVIWDFHFTEGAEKNKPAIPPRDKNLSLLGLSNRLFTGKGGNIQHEFFHYLGFRYLTVVCRGNTKQAMIKLNVRLIEYPFKNRGYFNCSDQELTDIYKACKKTQQICSLDTYVDTPWREQALWFGDLKIQAQNTFFMDGDHRLLERALFLAQQASSGLTYGHAPTCAHNLYSA